MMHRGTCVHCPGGNGANGREDIFYAVVELSMQYPLMFLCPFAFCNINVSAHNTVRAATGIIRNQGPRLDPSDLPNRQHNPIFAIVITAPFGNVLLEVILQPKQVIRVNSRAPLGARAFTGSLRQAVNGSIARRDLHLSRGYVECKASDPSNFNSKGKLCVALGECLLSPLAERDVSSHAE